MRVNSSEEVIIGFFHKLNEKKIRTDDLSGTYKVIHKTFENNSHYDSIARMVYENGFIEDKSIETLVNNLDFLEINEEESKKYIFRKIRNHFYLSIVQNAHITNKVTDLNKKVDDAETQLDEMKDIKGQIYTEFIAILGIFSALIFGLFGGFDAISNIVQTTFKAGVELPNIMIAISLTLGSLSLLLFSLMQGIKILSKSSLKSCGCENTKRCNHSVFQRHPVMSLNLIALSSVFVVSLLIKIIPRDTFEILYRSDQYLYYGLVLIGILLIVIMILALNSSEQKKEEKKKKKKKRKRSP